MDVLGAGEGLGDDVGTGLAAHEQGVIVFGVGVVEDGEGVAADVAWESGGGVLANCAFS